MAFSLAIVLHGLTAISYEELVGAVMLCTLLSQLVYVVSPPKNP